MPQTKAQRAEATREKNAYDADIKTEAERIEVKGEARIKVEGDEGVVQGRSVVNIDATRGSAVVKQEEDGVVGRRMSRRVQIEAVPQRVGNVQPQQIIGHPIKRPREEDDDEDDAEPAPQRPRVRHDGAGRGIENMLREHDLMLADFGRRRLELLHIKVNSRARYGNIESPGTFIENYPTPPIEWAEQAPASLSEVARHLLYYGISPSTRIMYKTYQDTYENFCYRKGVPAFPVSKEPLANWIAEQSAMNEAFRGNVSEAIEALKSVHIDRDISLKVFETEYIKRVMAGLRNLPYRVEDM